MQHLASTNDPNIARQILANNPGSYAMREHNGTIQIYSNPATTAPPKKAKQKQKHHPAKPANIHDRMPWYLLAAAGISIIFALLQK